VGSEAILYSRNLLRLLNKFETTTMGRFLSCMRTVKWRRYTHLRHSPVATYFLEFIVFTFIFLGNLALLHIFFYVDFKVGLNGWVAGNGAALKEEIRGSY